MAVDLFERNAMFIKRYFEFVKKYYVILGDQFMIILPEDIR